MRAFKVVILVWLLVTPVWGTNLDFPLVQNFSYLPPLTPFHQEAKTVSMYYNASYSNIFMFNSDYSSVNDMEILNQLFFLRYSFSPRLHLEITTRFVFIHAGLFDGIIENVHDLFDISQGGRDQYPRNTLKYSYRDYFNYEKSLFTVAHPLLSLAVEILNQKHFIIAGRIGCGIPLVHKPGIVSGKPFLLMGVTAEWLYQHIHLLWAGHLSFITTPEWLDMETLDPTVFHSELQIRIAGFFCGFIFRTSPFHTPELANHGYQMYAGFRIRRNIEIYLAEEIPPMDTTPDVTLNLRIRLK